MKAMIIAGLLLASTVPAWSNVYGDVAKDAVISYEIAKRAGDTATMCAQAIMIQQTFLLAHDEANYIQWTAVAKHDCPFLRL